MVVVVEDVVAGVSVFESASSASAAFVDARRFVSGAKVTEDLRARSEIRIEMICISKLFMS